MRELTTGEIAWLKLELEPKQWELLTDWWSLTRVSTVPHLYEIHHVGFTVEEFHRDVIGSDTNFWGTPSSFGNVVSVWQWVELDADTQYIMGFATGQQRQMAQKAFTSRDERALWLSLDQPFRDQSDYYFYPDRPGWTLDVRRDI